METPTRQMLQDYSLDAVWKNDYPPFEERGNDRAAYWGYGVTICIAALCDDRKSIVFATDSKVDFGDFSTDYLAHKYTFLTDKWTALFAGNDVEFAPEILGCAGHRLRKMRRPRPLQVVRAVNAEIHRKQDENIECAVLRKFGFTVEYFLKNGKRLCGEHIYADLAIRVAAAKISFSALIGGFDPDGHGHLLVAEANRAPGSADSVGFWAVGSGRPLAMGSLAFAANYRRFSEKSTLGDAIYAVLEAKFMAEQNAYVGRDTTLLAFSDSGRTMHGIMPSDIAKLRQLWLEQGAPRVPQSLPEKLPSLVRSVLRKDVGR